MIKAVFLDFYNTIVYFVPPRDERQAQACREFGIQVSPQALWKAYIRGEDFWTEANAQRPIYTRSQAEQDAFYAEYEQTLLAAAGIVVDRELAFRIYRRYSQLPRELALFPDVEPTIAELKRRGLVVGLISNTDKDVGPVCETLGVAQGLDFMLSSCAVGYEKPDPRIFQAALAKAGVAPEEAIHVGDQYKSDVVGALASGIRPLLLDRYGALGHLDGCPHITSLSEIVQHLG